MIRFFRTVAQPADSVWKEMRRLWKHDTMREKHFAGQLHELKRWLLLDQCQLWLAWNDDPPPPAFSWMTPQHCIGSVITFTGPSDTLNVQFAGGRFAPQWMHRATQILEAYAERQGCKRLDVYIRKGWIQELPRAWKLAPHITIYRDPELLRVYPEARLGASA